ncbi:tripartite tricarboxylate transporter TctB family protein [Paenibacillus validus]|uniref:tripartite tricarboxylate transporter TctB family protein n=1 Tax=Paenibacillus validus TaxID=44253 RepID=UPI0012D8D9E4|nr:tripartite tricarboxylate transporter TctB family protein [Paenibacillus validus]
MDHAKESGLVKNAGFWTGIVLLIFASIVFWQSFSLKYYTAFGPGPGMFPRWLSGILIIISIVYIWQSVKKEVFQFKDIFPKGRELGNILSVLASVVVFMLIVNFTGFIIASTILLFILLVREYKWYSGLAISAVTSIILFIVFKSFFDIPLPVNMFGW